MYYVCIPFEFSFSLSLFLSLSLKQNTSHKLYTYITFVYVISSHICMCKKLILSHFILPRSYVVIDDVFDV